jgi:hypothetical protein
MHSLNKGIIARGIIIPVMEPSTDALKRRLRQYKKRELAIRFKDRPMPENPELVWDTFFSTKSEHAPNVKYPLHQLSQMSPAELQQVFEEYFYRVYFQNYKENGLTAGDIHAPQLLALLGLPPYAGLQDIKKRYRELAKRHHPDHGGDSQKFIELLEVYEKLTRE